MKIFSLFFLFLAGILTTGAHLCQAQSNTLKYLANAFVEIKTSEGKVIYIDPYSVNAVDSADIVLITHEHSDHNELSRIIQKPTCQVIRSANALIGTVYQTFTIGDIIIKAVPAYTYDGYHPRYFGVGYVVEFNGIKLYHGGDTDSIPEMANLASENIDYTLLPMWIGASAMTRAVGLTQTKYCIPVHPNNPSTLYDPAAVMPFTSSHRLVVLPGQIIELSNDTTPYVSRVLRVPQDYSTIQSAINNSKNSDTVLVSEGRYIENINYYWKKIVVTSRYYLTKNWQTVQNTIIDGSSAADKNNASTVTLLNGLDSTAVLDGFTITGGSGTLWIYGSAQPQEGGGIIMNLSSAVIRNNIITNNTNRTSAGVIGGGGGGISSLYSNPTIYNNIIFSNASGYAGGIVLNWSKGKIRNNIVCHNSTNGQYGAGGIMVWQAPQNGGIVENNTIVGNTSTSIGGGMSISVTDATTIPVISNNIIWGNSQVSGGQIDAAQYLTGYNDVEDYSGGTNISVFPQLLDNSFLLAGTSPCIDAGNVAAVSNDIENSANPGFALSPSQGAVRNDIGAFGGPYAKALSPMDIGDLHVSSSSVSMQCSIGLQATASIEVLNTSSKGLVIDSIKMIDSTTFSLNKDFTHRTVPFLKADSVIITFKPDTWNLFSDTLKIYHNAAGQANPLLIPIHGSSNKTPYAAKTLSAQSATVGKLYTWTLPDSTFLDDDAADTLTYQASGMPSWLSFDANTKTFQGTPVTYTKTRSTITVTVTDHFQATASTSFKMTILAATDVGDLLTAPAHYELLHNYPNPFNPSTTIRYELKNSCRVQLTVHDIMGRVVASLVNRTEEQGTHTVSFDASHFASGIYFLRLQTPEFNAVEKIMLIK